MLKCVYFLHLNTFLFFDQIKYENCNHQNQLRNLTLTIYLDKYN